MLPLVLLNLYFPELMSDSADAARGANLAYESAGTASDSTCAVPADDGTSFCCKRTAIPSTTYAALGAFVLAKDPDGTAGRLANSSHTNATAASAAAV